MGRDWSEITDEQILELASKVGEDGLPILSVREEIRLDAGLTVKQLAALLEVPHTSLARWEAGGLPGRVEVRERYARVLRALDRAHEQRWAESG